MTRRICAALLLLALGTASAQGDRTHTLRHGGRDRTYLLHLPAGHDPAKPIPLVLDFHGLTSNSSTQAMISGFRALADQEGFAVAWPQGVGSSWNAGAGCCGQALQEKLDDVGFARAVVAHVDSLHAVDRRRVYATGLSNGGALTQRLAAEAADLFAAAAGFAGMLLVPARPTRPIAIINFHGYDDATVPYAGGGFMPSAPSAFKAWGDASACAPAPAVKVLAGASKCETRAGCSAGVEAALCSIEGEHVIYFNTPNLKLAPIAWAFLSRFALPAGPTGLARPRLTGGPAAAEARAGAARAPAWRVEGEGYGADGRRHGAGRASLGSDPAGP